MLFVPCATDSIMPKPHDLTDPDDFCRRCGGRRMLREWLGGDRFVWEPCGLCRGTGKHTIRID
ncbi:hypothetical protein C2I36_08035 [Rhodobacteraceae bacterium WD3A24]|nr:hypothetical protein C2I36_08035 [Rhodobacteraceae bacterium WD3A24]